jgi:hypothetical protein
MNEYEPIQPYVTPIEQLPDTEQLQQVVLDESHSRPRAGRVAVGVATALLAIGGGLFAYNRSSRNEDQVSAAPADMFSNPNIEPTKVENLCYSPAVEQTFSGDSKVTSDDPADWTKGVLVTVAQPKSDDFRGTVIGFHGPDETVDATTWSYPLEPGQLDDVPALMRTGHGAYTIAVENVAVDGSALCGTTPKVTFAQTAVEAALAVGAIEPDY